MIDRGFIHPRQAARIIYRILLRSPEGDLLPSYAPEEWKVEAFGANDPSLYVRKQKARVRAQKSLQIGLVTGRVKAIYVDGDRRAQIPTWAWEHDERVDYVWNEGRLPLDALLPDRWQRVSRNLCLIEKTGLREWLTRDFPQMGCDLPSELRSERRPPARVKQREPGQQPYLPLCEAVSWIAFSVALPSEILCELIQTGEIGQGYEWANTRLEAAVAQFADAALVGKLRCIGKYKRSYADTDPELTDFIPAIRFADFRRLDIPRDGLFYGTGLAQRMKDNVLHLQRGEGRKDLLFDIRVDRGDLLAHFGGGRAQHQAATPRRVARGVLEKWFRQLPERDARRSQRELHAMAKMHFASAVPREWIRQLTAGRKPGPREMGR